MSVSGTKTMSQLFNEWVEFTIQVHAIFGIRFPSQVAAEAVRQGKGPPTLEEYANMHKLRIFRF